MKYFLIFLVLVGCIVFVPEVLGAKQNLFEGNSSFERLPDTIIPETLYEFELKFQITDSPYWLHGMTPVVDINPKTDASNIHINFEKIPTGFYAIYRVPVTLYVDQNISSEKIFLNISFVSENSSGDELRSSWSESTILNISQLSLPGELPSSQDYEFETMTGASCTDDSSACFGTFHNGTTIPIQCDYRHSCGVVSFSKETYKLEEKSPLKQFKLGVPIYEIQCKETLLLIKRHDGSPVCVTPETREKLKERGWDAPLLVAVNRDAPNVYLESTPLDIASIEDRYIHLNPVDTCATVSLRLLSPDDLKQTKSGTKDVVFFELDDQSMEEFPVLGELIRATRHLEFPSNEHAQTEIGLKEFVDYEFFIMEKAIDKYNDTQDDYFMKLDGNLDEKLANPKKQGFSNEFIAPQIVYNDQTYTMGSTVFWIADEHEMQSISIRLQDNLKEDEKYVTLTDQDMDSVPKIKQTIEKIGTELESIVAFKGMPENPDWNNYREWFDQKKTEQFNLSDVYVRGFVYEGEYYDLGFPIC